MVATPDWTGCSGGGARSPPGGELGVVFALTSPDGAQGFPGRLDVRVRYALSRRRNVLTLTTEVSSDRPTVANLINHSYFNMAGGGDVGCEELRVDAERYVETDARKLPTGRRLPVDGTPLDFRVARALAPSVTSADPLIMTAGGLDHYLVLRRGGRAVLTDPVSGRRLTMSTDQPGVQVYAGNALDGRDRDARGRPIVRHGGLAIEAGRVPGGPAAVDDLSTRLAPGRPMRSVVRWAFDARRPAAAGDACGRSAP